MYMYKRNVIYKRSTKLISNTKQPWTAPSKKYKSEKKSRENTKPQGLKVVFSSCLSTVAYSMAFINFLSLSILFVFMYCTYCIILLLFVLLT